MNEMSGSLRVSGSKRHAGVAFTGENKAFRHLATLGGLWEILTFGFYRSWLITDMRGHLWAHSSVEGEALEYTGRGVEELIRFLIALAVIVPGCFLFSIFIRMESGRLKPFIGLSLFLLFYCLSQFAVYRAHRYRLTRTVWRGTAFRVSGSGIDYALRALLWLLITGVTLGLAYPWSVAAQERYKLAHVSYGDFPGAFTGTGRTFFKCAWWLWAVALIPLLCFAAVTFAPPSVPDTASNAALRDEALGQILLAYLLASSTLVILPFAYAAMKAIEWKWRIESIRFGEVRFTSDLRRTGLVAIHWKLISMTCLAVVFGLVSPLLLLFKDPHSNADSGFYMALIFITIPCFLGMILLIGILRRIYLTQQLWKTLAGSITVHHLEIIADSTA